MQNVHTARRYRSMPKPTRLGQSLHRPGLPKSQLKISRRPECNLGRAFIIGKMYCPKCDQRFEEGSRRFCPTDGSRLVSDSATAGAARKGGVFANLIPQMEGVRDLEATIP